MDPPPPPTPTSSTAKLRLMCSYGGHILPRPLANSLCYAGGDTRIVATDRHAVTTLSSFVAHLSSALSLNCPFTLKYQLPHLDLDSLISLTSDDDFHILIEEHDRLSSSPSPVPSRIRLFLFPTHPDSARPVIRHPKTEAWFFDALKSAKIMQKGRHSFLGNIESEPQEGELTRAFLSSGPESMVLETSSSFGSTSSSASLSNLPSIRAHGEDNEPYLKDSKVKLTPTDTVPSDNTVSSVMPRQQNISYQDPVVHASDGRVNAESIEAESKVVPNISSGVIVNNTNMDLGFASFPQFNQMQRPHLQFVQADTHFLPLHPSSLLPVPSWQHIYQQPQPLQHLVYHQNQPQPYPVYLVPVGNITPNSVPITASSQASLNLNASFMNGHVAQNCDGEGSSPFAYDFASQNYITDNAAASFVHHIPYNGSQQPEMDIYPMFHRTQSISIASRESPKHGNELDEDPAYVQIYKSQPPPPTLPSKYQTMTKSTTDLLPEAFVEFQVDNLKQEAETTSQP